MGFRYVVFEVLIGLWVDFSINLQMQAMACGEGMVMGGSIP